jgi:LEA14-like dessication related protein
MHRSLALALSLAVVGLALGAGCHPAQSPSLHVLGVHEEPRHDVVFVQVTNPASHPMRLTRLQYRFAAAGETVSEGEMALAREVPAGAAVVVEIPLDSPPEKPMTLSGKLTAELDQIIQIFSVSAQIAPAAPGPDDPAAK